MQMGPCQVYGVTLIYLQGEAEIQTCKEKASSRSWICEKKSQLFFADLLLTIQKGVRRSKFPEING